MTIDHVNEPTRISEVHHTNRPTEIVRARATADALFAIFEMLPVDVCPKCHGPRGYNVEGCEECTP
jgi:hypothetical protein